jgi:HD superfamily phosphohydrolase
MPASKRKIINDPIYGLSLLIILYFFLSLIIPGTNDYAAFTKWHWRKWFTRVRYIHALHHSLGAYHLITLAITELKHKNIDITNEEEVAAKAAILLHDIGHGPFSHALENVLIPGVHHETIGLQIMHRLNEKFEGKLSTAVSIFTGQYNKQFLHQLISGQLDVDRMDYLTRDSFFTGVSEGVYRL